MKTTLVFWQRRQFEVTVDLSEEEIEYLEQNNHPDRNDGDTELSHQIIRKIDQDIEKVIDKGMTFEDVTIMNV